MSSLPLQKPGPRISSLPLPLPFPLYKPRPRRPRHPLSLLCGASPLPRGAMAATSPRRGPRAAAARMRAAAAHARSGRGPRASAACAERPQTVSSGGLGRWPSQPSSAPAFGAPPPPTPRRPWRGGLGALPPPEPPCRPRSLRRRGRGGSEAGRRAAPSPSAGPRPSTSYPGGRGTGVCAGVGGTQCGRSRRAGVRARRGGGAPASAGARLAAALPCCCSSSSRRRQHPFSPLPRGGTAQARAGAAAVEARGGAAFARPGVRIELGPVAMAPAGSPWSSLRWRAGAAAVAWRAGAAVVARRAGRTQRGGHGVAGRTHRGEAAASWRGSRGRADAARTGQARR